MQVHVYHQLQKRHYQAALHHERMWVPTLKLFNHQFHYGTLGNPQSNQIYTMQGILLP
jgi:hypothetical protein